MMTEDAGCFLPMSDLQEPKRHDRKDTMYLQVPFSRAVEWTADCITIQRLHVKVREDIAEV